jgi:hypothetical protein
LSQIFSYPTGSMAPDIKTITGNSGGPISPDIAGNIAIEGLNPIDVSGNPVISTLTISVEDATDIQKGVIELATNLETIVGADTTRAITPDDLKAKLGAQTDHGVAIGATQTAALNWTTAGSNGELLIAATGADPAFASLTSTGSTIVFTPGANTLNLETGAAVPISFHTDGAAATPAAGVITIAGGNNLISSGAGSTVTLDLNGTTDHALQVGNGTGSLSSLAVLGDGQLAIGRAGADPLPATLTPGTGISITNAAGSITIAANGTTTLAYTPVNTSPYVVLPADDFISVDSSGGAITIQLPNAATAGKAFIIKDRTGSAAVHAITVTTVGGVVLIDGAATFVMNTAYESVNIIGNASAYEVY